MSTKIHNGYRICGPTAGRPDPFVVLEDVRAAIGAVYRTAYATALAHRAAEALDTATVNGTEPPFRPVFAVNKELEAAHKEANADGLRRPDSDFQFSLLLLSDPADPTGPLYALVYTERDDFTAVWEQLPGVDEYAYWNSTDRPDHLTDADWDVRRDTWDRLVGRDVPADRGLGWDLLGRYPRLTPRCVRDEVAAAIPTRRERARAVARSTVYTVEVLVEGDLRRGIRWREPEVIAAEMDAETARVEPLLGDLTVEDLYGPETRRRPASA